MVEQKEVIRFNVVFKCDRKCEDCENFFDCKDPVKWKVYYRRRMSKAIERMEKIKYKIAISGGKGGVGKSTVAANLAAVYAMSGAKVSILDQDFDGSTIPKMFGIQGEKRLKYGVEGLIPAEDKLGLGIQIVSLSLVYPDEVITMFHELRRNLTEEFLVNVSYGERDYLIVDLPPGTSSDACNLLQYIPNIDGVVTVTMPTQISQLTARKATLLAAKAGVRTLGVIENMSGYTCSHCKKAFDLMTAGGGEALAKELEVPFLGGIPLNEEVASACDEGIPFVYKYPSNPASVELKRIASRLERRMRRD